MQVHVYRVIDADNAAFYQFISEEAWTAFVAKDDLNERLKENCLDDLLRIKSTPPENAFMISDKSVEVLALDESFDDAWDLIKVHALLE